MQLRSEQTSSLSPIKTRPISPRCPCPNWKMNTQVRTEYWGSCIVLSAQIAFHSIVDQLCWLNASCICSSKSNSGCIGVSSFGLTKIARLHMSSAENCNAKHVEKRWWKRSGGGGGDSSQMIGHVRRTYRASPQRPLMVQFSLIGRTMEFQLLPEDGSHKAKLRTCYISSSISWAIEWAPNGLPILKDKNMARVLENCVGKRLKNNSIIQRRK